MGGFGWHRRQWVNKRKLSQINSIIFSINFVLVLISISFSVSSSSTVLTAVELVAVNGTGSTSGQIIMNQYLHKTAVSLAKPVYASSKAPLCFDVSNTLVKKSPISPN